MSAQDAALSDLGTSFLGCICSLIGIAPLLIGITEDHWPGPLEDASGVQDRVELGGERLLTAGVFALLDRKNHIIADLR
ncbi:hypothetical protein [Streptomyces sp. NPDC002133]|uniref:hypothetical protein n=1 Tax=Streptomyces sp. NPDC002133 TaxID=3154409 RepID=UPI00332A8688